MSEKARTPSPPTPDEIMLDEDDDILLQCLLEEEPLPTKRLRLEFLQEFVKGADDQQPCCSKSVKTDDGVWDENGDKILMAVGDGEEGDWGDDNELVEICESIENDGVPVQNRFKSWIGHPHPLLVPHVLKQVLSYTNDEKSLLSARVVCHQWKEAADDEAFKVATFRNVSHATARYPYGLGRGHLDQTSEAPLPPPTITRLFVRDPCLVLSRPETRRFFESQGSKLTYIGYDANLFCKDQWEFIRRVLMSWCKELREIEFVGVSCFDSLVTYSELYGGGFVEVKMLKLQKVVVRCSEGGGRDHYHYSSVNTRGFFPRYYFLDRLSSRRDGGLLSRIFKMSEITEFVFHFNFSSLNMYFAHMRVFGVTFTHLRILELIGVGGNSIGSTDFRILTSCNLRVKVLRIGPLNCCVNHEVIERFLVGVSDVLEVFEVRGVFSGSRALRIVFPVMRVLKRLVFSDFINVIVERGFGVVVDLPLLECLEIGCGGVDVEMVGGVTDRLVEFFGGGVDVHPNLKEVRVSGSFFGGFDYTVVLRGIMRVCPGVKVLYVGCGGGSLRDCVGGYSGFRFVEEFGVSGYGVSGVGGVVCGVSRGFEVLGKLVIDVGGNVPLRVWDAERLRGGGFVEFRGVELHDNESFQVAKILAEKYSFTVFNRCQIVKPGVYDRNDASKIRVLDNCVLNLANLYVLKLSVFCCI